MRIDLPKSKATALSIDFTANELTPDVVKHLIELSGNRRRSLYLVGSYRRSGLFHLVTLIAHPEREDPNSLHIVINYTVMQQGIGPGPDRSIFRHFPKIVEMVDFLEGLGLEAEVRCRAVFDYVGEETRSIIPLPLKLFEGVDLPFSDIIGVHFRQQREDETSYSIIVDQKLEPETGFHHSVSHSSTRPVGHVPSSGVRVRHPVDVV